MNPEKNKARDSPLSLTHVRRAILQGFFGAFLEPTMHTLLAVALLTACVVNVACLCGYL
jgi:hypothetical protein